MHVTINGIDTRYVLSSEGSGPWLTLIHPLGADLSVWDQLAQSFSSRYQVLRYDLRGHGHTKGNKAFTIDDLAADLHALFDVLAIPRSHIVGLSIGGMVAQTFALRSPERVDRLILCDTTPGTPAAARASFLSRAQQAREQGVAGLVEPTLERWLSKDFRTMHPEAIEQIRDVLLATDPEGYAAGCEAIAAFDASAHLHQITAPTLVVAGEDDVSTPVTVIENLSQAIRHARCRILPGAHLAPIEHPGRFAAILNSFLQAETSRFADKLPV